MTKFGPYLFKRATEPAEFEQVHRLNYQTFVREVGQYADSGAGELVDKFHDKNHYLIGLKAGRLVGMLCAHGHPPFSVADRLPDPGLLTRPGVRPLEVRLLAVEPGERHGQVCLGVFVQLLYLARAGGYTDLFISALAGQVRLYEHLGFRPLGPAVGKGEAKFVPMAVDMPRLEETMRRTVQQWERRMAREDKRPLDLLPGPVVIGDAVRHAIAEPAIYHRGDEFLELFTRIRTDLARLAHAKDVAILVGSGTLANETIAANIAATPHAQHGLMLVNGEFSHRLVKQSARFGLKPHVLTWDWGQPWDLDEVAVALDRLPPGGWVWGVHQESSTGVLNDLPGLIALAKERGIRVVADCVSSLAAVPVDLSEVWLGACASGKALGSYAGLAFVFADPRTLSDIDTERVPSYFDLPAILATSGPRYTVPSPLARALDAALEPYRRPEQAQQRLAYFAELGSAVRDRLRSLGITPLADESCASPVITTFAPPDGEASATFVERCMTWGYQIAGHSGYLAERGLVQIATMGAIRREDVLAYLDQLEKSLAGKLTAAAVG